MSAVLAFALVPACRAFARRFGYTVRPTADRWHRHETPMLGGLAVFAATAGAVAVLVRPLDALRVYLLTGALGVGIGLADDLWNLKPVTKLAAQAGLAAVFIAAGYRLYWFDSATVDAIVTLLWIVGVTNAFNFIDNMDGLCAGVAVLAGVSLLMIMAPQQSAGTVSLFLGAFVGAIAAFLFYNRSPASIFLGDTGSMFIGVAFAGLTLELPRHDQAPHVVAVVATPMLLLLVPLFDTIFVTLERLIGGRNASQGGRDHSSHRLVAMGLGERAAVRLLWIVAAAGAMTAWALRQMAIDWAIVTLIAVAVSLITAGVRLGRVRV